MPHRPTAKARVLAEIPRFLPAIDSYQRLDLTKNQAQKRKIKGVSG